ncbi:MAG: formate/nitrite transporter family protein [Lachnospiraceae bacterium]|nr:formate/nitrite transporter family protein [Lachnospiraceae bacterium]
MFREEYRAVADAAVLKYEFLKSNPFGYFVACVLAGMYIGFGVLLAALYRLTGLGTDAVGAFMASGAAAKMAASPSALFVRGILCNMLVCIAVWCGFRCKSESGKLIMIFWCLLAFFTTGFEHSVANMTLLSYALMNPMGQAVTLGGWLYNLAFVTLGNMVGGIVFVGVPYMLIQKK